MATRATYYSVSFIHEEGCHSGLILEEQTWICIGNLWKTKVCIIIAPSTEQVQRYGHFLAIEHSIQEECKKSFYTHTAKEMQTELNKRIEMVQNSFNYRRSFAHLQRSMHFEPRECGMNASPDPKDGRGSTHMMSPSPSEGQACYPFARSKTNRSRQRQSNAHFLPNTTTKNPAPKID